MERMEIGEKRKAIAVEHYQRYLVASKFAHGSVLDIACGNGYGARILVSEGHVSSYLGVDKYAVVSDTEGLELENVCFSRSIPEFRFDTVISIETAEHFEKPAEFMSTLMSKITNDGILAFCVPTKDYDDLCDSVYGKNPYHLSKITVEELDEYFAANFFYHRKIYLFVTVGGFATSRGIVTVGFSEDKMRKGSVLYVATNSAEQAQKIAAIDVEQYMDIGSMPEYDRELTMPYTLQLEQALDYIKVLEARLAQHRVVRKNKIWETLDKVRKSFPRNRSS